MALDDEKIEEIEALRASAATTRRATVPALEEMLYKPIPVLDHGFIRVIDYMGDDAAIVQAARVSYGRGTKQVSNDRGLINYLMRHRHTSPFEMCEIKLHVKLPIFVARQWIRHRMANVNEYSARYSVLDREFYVPDQEFVRLQKAQRQTAPAQTQPVRRRGCGRAEAHRRPVGHEQAGPRRACSSATRRCRPCARSGASPAAPSPPTRSSWATRSARAWRASSPASSCR